MTHGKSLDQCVMNWNAKELRIWRIFPCSSLFQSRHQRKNFCSNPCSNAIVFSLNGLICNMRVHYDLSKTLPYWEGRNVLLVRLTTQFGSNFHVYLKKYFSCKRRNSYTTATDIFTVTTFHVYSELSQIRLSILVSPPMLLRRYISITTETFLSYTLILQVCLSWSVHLCSSDTSSP